LRRQTIGLIQIIREKEFHFSLEAIVRKGVSLYVKKSNEETAEVEARILDFIRMRLSHLLEEEGFSRDVIASVVSVSIDDIPKTYERVKALETLKAMPDFEPIAVCFKRVVNIIRKASLPDIIQVDESIFKDRVEKNLYTAFLKTQKEVAACVEQGEYKKALAGIATLRGPVDAFFDGVMVMAEEEALRNNRLSILKEISTLFGGIADFSMIST
jgi:glycyl-tRNA synthetase beta chain